MFVALLVVAPPGRAASVSLIGDIVTYNADRGEASHVTMQFGDPFRVRDTGVARLSSNDCSATADPQLVECPTGGFTSRVFMDLGDGPDSLDFGGLGPASAGFGASGFAASGESPPNRAWRSTTAATR